MRTGNCRYLGIIFLFVFMFVFMLINVNFVCGKNISTEYPENIGFEEEFDFQVELIDFETANYDIKIDINEESRIARIWDGTKWGSTSYYIQNAILSGENSAVLKMKITEQVNGEFPIVIKIRKNSQTSYDKFEGFSIVVDSISGEVEIVKETEEEINYEIVEEVKDIEVNNEDDKSSDGGEVEVSGGDDENSGDDNKPADITGEVIYLEAPNSKDIKTDENTKVLFKSVDEKIKDYAIYGFTFFCIVIIILLLIDRRK